MRTIAAAGFALAIAVVLAATHPSGAEALPVPAPAGIVQISTGRISGTSIDGNLVYRDIPYAAPPVGPLRWRAPAPPAAWPGIRAADDFGPACPQAQPPHNVDAGSRGETTSEDCLTLNVWRPAVRATALPVMVWLHGGGNASGSAADHFDDGGAFARDGVVLVSLNYRLGVLGFFAAPAFATEPAGDGMANFGLMDQLAALRWVHDNIAAFGGNPANVTVFGESAGGEDALALAESDVSRGYMTRAILESAGDLFSGWPTLEEARRKSQLIANRLGVAGTDAAAAARLRALPVEKLMQVRDEDQLGPVVDGTIVASRPTRDPARRLRVPILIGTNDDDGSIADGIGDPNALFPQLSRADVQYVDDWDRRHGVTNSYAVARRLFGDGYFTAPAEYVAARATEAGQRAYVYRFDYVLDLLSSRRPAATHGSEIPFVFESLASDYLSPADRAVEADLHGCWVAFARNGVPVCEGVPAWPPYDARDPKIMIFGREPVVRIPANEEILQYLESRLAPEN